MKVKIKQVILGILIYLSVISSSFAQTTISSEVNDLCKIVAATAGSISQAFAQGKTQKEISALTDSVDFRALSADKQAITFSLIRYVAYLGLSVSAYDNYNGAYRSCISYEGNLKEMSDAINAVLKSNSI